MFLRNRFSGLVIDILKVSKEIKIFSHIEGFIGEGIANSEHIDRSVPSLEFINHGQ